MSIKDLITALKSGDIRPVFNPGGSIATLYRWRFVQYNDGTTGKGLQYASEFGNWHGSGQNNQEEYFNNLEVSK